MPQKAPSKKKRGSIQNTIIQLETQLDNLKYSEKQAIQYTHWTPAQFDEMDYFELNDIMAAEYTETVNDFQVANNLSDQELAERHTSRDRLARQAGRMSLQEAIAHVKSNQAKKGGK